jgi:predicted Zn-dependent protease
LKPDDATAFVRNISADEYPKAIRLHQAGKSNEAVGIMKKLIAEFPDDIYYKDTLAQILCESGKAADAVNIYRKFCNEKSHVLLKIDFAKALLEADTDVDRAISILEAAKYVDCFNDEIFRLLAKGYGKKGKRGIAFLMLAREQILLQNYDRACELLEQCLRESDKKTETAIIKKAQYFKDLIKREQQSGLIFSGLK